MTDTVPKAAIRSAESDRLSTCKLADRIARASVDAYRQHCPEYLSNDIKQTVISTIVAQVFLSKDRNFSEFSSELLVLSVGQGTKVIPMKRIESARNFGIRAGQGDRIVRDCHAEVLARRGFLAYLYGIVETDSIETSRLFEVSDLKKLRLRSNVRLHLYTSSQPCGNATMKKWAKSSKPTQYNDLSSDEIPNEVHARIQINSRAVGQVAVLVKKNNHDESSQPSSSSNVQSLASANYEFPIGTSPTDRAEGNVMTCSDKIAKWNALGLQGSLLTQFFEPIYLSTITVGRKFSRVHCERALCCRLQGFCFPCREIGIIDQCRKKSKLNSAPSSADSSSSSEANIVLHHPVMMSTSIKLDESAIITGDTSNRSTSDVAIGAQFADYRSFCMWRSGSTSTTQSEWIQEVLDGRTGFLYQESTGEDEGGADGEVSLISSFTLGAKYSSLVKTTRSYQDCKSGLYKAETELNDYTMAKNVLISHKDYFPEWIRKT